MKLLPSRFHDNSSQETWTKRSFWLCPILIIDPVRYVLPSGIVKLIPEGELSHGVEANPKDSFTVGRFSSTSQVLPYDPLNV